MKNTSLNFRQPEKFGAPFRHVISPESIQIVFVRKLYSRPHVKHCAIILAYSAGAGESGIVASSEYRGFEGSRIQVLLSMEFLRNSARKWVLS